MSPDEKVARLAERQFGIISNRQAIDCSLSQDQIDRRIGERWLQLYRAVYKINGVLLGFEGRVLAAVFAAGEGALASSLTSGRLFAVEGITSSQLHISVPEHRRVVVPGVRVHTYSNLGPHATRVGKIPVTSPIRTLIDLAALLQPDTLEDALDDMWRRRLLTPERCLQELARLGKRRGSRTLRPLLAARVGKRPSGSGRENATRRLMMAFRLPEPEVQYPIYGEDGTFIARPDLVYVAPRIYIEFDSTKWHGSKSSLARDHDRQNRLAAEGWLPFIVDDTQLTHHQTELVANVRRAFAARSAGKAQLKAKKRAPARTAGKAQLNGQKKRAPRA